MRAAESIERAKREKEALRVGDGPEPEWYRRKDALRVYLEARHARGAMPRPNGPVARSCNREAADWPGMTYGANICSCVMYHLNEEKFLGMVASVKDRDWVKALSLLQELEVLAEALP